MSTAEQIIAEVLRERHPVSVVDAAHVVAALTNAGKTIVELPDADVVVANFEGEFGYSMFRNPVASISAANDGTVEVVMGREVVTELSPDDADRVGIAWLAAAAAARVAEGGEHGE